MHVSFWFYDTFMLRENEFISVIPFRSESSTILKKALISLEMEGNMTDQASAVEAEFVFQIIKDSSN